MKLSFSIPSKSSSRPKVTPAAAQTQDDAANDVDRKEYVTEFDPSKTLTNSKPKHVIPPMENEWRPYKKMKNLDLPHHSDPSGSGLQFEVESLTGDALGAENISYGLNLRHNSNESTVPNGDGSEVAKSQTVEQVLLRSLRDDLQRLPEDRGFEEFQDITVEGFGAALLGGYGWKEGQGIGKNRKEDVKVKEYKKWTNREGLGFDIDTSRVQDAKIRQKDSVKSDELREKSGEDGFVVGKEVRIITGRDMGLKGKIVEKLDSDLVVLRLSRSKDEVEVSVNEIADVGSKEEEKCLKKLKELRIREERQSNHKEKDKRVSKHSSKTDRATGKNEREETKDSRREKGVPSWLRSHIRVRIISKDLKGGRLYLKKGEVVDVVGPTICNIAMDGTRELVQGIEQELLETALPRRGGPVVVLYGKHKGAYGSLVEKDLDRETGVVRDADSHKMLDVKLEQIAEYLGDPSDIGY